MQHRGRRILSANVSARLQSVAANAFYERSTHIEILDRHGLSTSEARYRLMYTMLSVFPSCLLAAVVLWAVD